MVIKEISLDRYAEMFPQDHSVYDSPAFIRLNVYKVPEIKVLALQNEDGKLLVAQVFGLKADGWHAPFSAPFSVPVVAPEAGGEEVLEFYRQLPVMLGADVTVTFPAECYGSYPLPEGDVVNDYNYHYPMSRLADYESFLSRSGRYSHHRALKHDFLFEATDDIARAYEVIRLNRKAMGYPLAMTLDQVIETAPITDARFFVLSLGGIDMAAAVVFHPMPGVGQVIYWGDVPQARPFRAMNSLPWHLFNWYASNCPHIHTIDIGPSSTDGILNRGLADYKLSIGCCETPKPTVKLSHQD